MKNTRHEDLFYNKLQLEIKEVISKEHLKEIDKEVLLNNYSNIPYNCCNEVCGCF